uniref:Uncharacterized protein n=1 Tax=Anguilla anguilla TaxID=7936 RepID=A0A0E9XWK6_ANGAN
MAHRQYYHLMKNTFSTYKNAKLLTHTRHTPSIAHSFRLPKSRPAI